MLRLWTGDELSVSVGAGKVGVQLVVMSVPFLVTDKSKVLVAPLVAVSPPIAPGAVNAIMVPVRYGAVITTEPLRPLLDELVPYVTCTVFIGAESSVPLLTVCTTRVSDVVRPAVFTQAVATPVTREYA